MPFKLLALALPLSLDTFAVSAAMGVAGLDRRERNRLALILAAFEAAMPMVGFLFGAALGTRLGDAAEWVAIAVLAAVGVYMLIADDDDSAADRLRSAHGWSIAGLGLAVSIDEFAVGLAVGLVGLPIALVVAVIAAQAFIASQIGTRVGARVAAHVREGAERLAGVALLVLAALLLGLRVSGHGS